MHRHGLSAGLGGLALLLLVVLYPVFFLGRQVAPESALRAVPPWRAQSGPLPAPPRVAIDAATALGPRLRSVAREGFAVALWNPWIGGGRAGWLASPLEGGAPLVVIASLVAAHDAAWTALLVLEIAAAFTASFWVLRRLGNDPGASLVGAVLYALAGPVTAHWLDWQGSAAALGPLALAPTLLHSPTPARRLAVWAGVLAVLLACGPPAVPFIALGIAFGLVAADVGPRGRLGVLGVIAFAAVAAVAIVLPPRWLERASAEPGTPPTVAAPTAPRASLRSLVGFHAAAEVAGAGTSKAASPSGDPSAAFVGAVSVVLALLGVASLPRTARGFWGAMMSITLLLSFAPSRWLGDGWLAARPMALLAFVIAVTAAFATAAILRVLPARAQLVIIVAVCVLACARLLPVAARHLMFADRLEATLPSPLPDLVARDDGRAAALLDAFPPDVGATLRYPDARAASLAAEPRYAAVLRLGPGGQLAAARIFDADFSRTGVRWVLEPSNVSLVSGEIFARIDQTEGVRLAPATDGGSRFAVTIPEGACRIGVRGLGARETMVVLQTAGAELRLVGDSALALESEAWRWYALPLGIRSGSGTLVVRGAERSAARLPIAWDRSALQLQSEGQGVRVWRHGLADAFAHLAAPALPGAAVGEGVTVPAPGGVLVEESSATRHVFRVESPAAARLVVLVKYRPMLWRARVDGRSTPTENADGVWTGVPVRAGTSAVVLEARVPTWTWLIASLGLGSVLAAFFVGRQR